MSHIYNVSKVDAYIKHGFHKNEVSGQVPPPLLDWNNCKKIIFFLKLECLLNLMTILLNQFAFEFV